MIESGKKVIEVDTDNSKKNPDTNNDTTQQTNVLQVGNPQQKIVKFNYLCICFYAFLTGTDFALVIPTLWDRLHIDHNASGTFMGVVISVYSASGVLCGLIMGKISDDRPTKIKIFYLFCTSFSIIGHILYFIGINKWMILFARLISGLCLGCTTVALAYIAKTSSLKQRTSLISLVMASRQLGLMLGPAFNLFLRETNFLLFDIFVVDRKSSPGLFMAVVWLLIFLVFIFIYKDPEPDKNSQIEKVELIQEKPQQTGPTIKEQASHFCRIEILVLLATTFFTYFNQTSLETLLIPFTEEYFQWNELHNSILFCVGGICIIGSYVMIRFLTMKFNDRVVLLTGIILILIGLGVGILALFLVEKVDISSQRVELNSTVVLNDGEFSKNLTNIKIVSYKLPVEIKAAFGIAFIFDVLGLPAIAICSASLFTKLVHNNVQGIGQGVQRGILGLGTILGPLFAGPLISMPVVIMVSCFGFIGIIFLCVLVSFRRLMPPATQIEEKKYTQTS